MLAVVAAFTVAVTDARADLFLRITVFNSANVAIGTNTFTVAMNPQTGFGTINGGLIAGGFNVTANSGLNSLQGGTMIQHTHTINFNYSGPTGAGSERLVVEMMGTNYNAPLGPVAFTSNGSPSQSGGATSLVAMSSGASLSNAGLPGTPGSLAGLAAGSITSGTGTLGSASSVLVPNPSNNGPVTMGPGLYSFYQVFTFSSFGSTGLGSMSGAASLSSVPEPTTMVGAFVGLACIGVARWRRRTSPTLA